MSQRPESYSSSVTEGSIVHRITYRGSHLAKDGISVFDVSMRRAGVSPELNGFI